MSQLPPPPLPVPPLEPQTQAVLPYATPTVHHAAGAWRGGAQLIITKNIQLPDRCVKCNAPGDGRMWNKMLYWHNPALYILIVFPGLLIYAIVAVCVRQKAQVGAFLCPVHRAKRKRTLLIVWLLVALGLAAFIGGIMLVGERETEGVGLAALCSGIVLMIGSGIFAAVATPLLSPAKMDGNYAWLKGAGSEFLATFPTTTGQ
jgi:hypothetical protein